MYLIHRLRARDYCGINFKLAIPQQKCIDCALLVVNFQESMQIMQQRNIRGSNKRK